MEADGEKRQNSAAERVKVLFSSAASDKVLPEGGALTMKGQAARIGWTHVFADMTSRWDTMMVIQDSEEMLDDGKNIMATCGVLAALILSFIFGSEPPTVDRYSIWVHFGDYDNFVAEIYDFLAFVLKLACTIEVLITSRSYIALCLVPPEAGRIMGYRMGGDIMMAWNFSMFAVITVCIALLILVHATMALRWGTSLACIAIFVAVLAHVGGLMAEIDVAAFAVNSTCERGVRQEEMREALRRARLGRWSVKQLAEWVATPRPESPRDVQEGHGFDAGIVTAFKQIDLNSDNEISLEELEQALANAEAAEAAAEQTEVERRSVQDLAAQAKKLMSQMDVRAAHSSCHVMSARAPPDRAGAGRPTTTRSSRGRSSESLCSSSRGCGWRASRMMRGRRCARRSRGRRLMATSCSRGTIAAPPAPAPSSPPPHLFITLPHLVLLLLNSCRHLTGHAVRVCRRGREDVQRDLHVVTGTAHRFWASVEALVEENSQDAVVTLTEETLRSSLNPATGEGKGFLLVFFFMPWCSKCKETELQWHLAATQVKAAGFGDKIAQFDVSTVEDAKTKDFLKARAHVDPTGGDSKRGYWPVVKCAFPSSLPFPASCPSCPSCPSCRHLLRPCGLALCV